ncbi:MAG: VWA domain-containing protein [Candidatus Acidiferrales bacterium]
MGSLSRSVKRCAAAVGASIFALTCAAQTLSPGEVRVTSRPYHPQNQILRAESHFVRIDAVVRDSKGHVVSGLKPEDFAIFQDGRKQIISAFEVETRQLRVPLKEKAAAPEQPASEPSLPVQSAPRPRYVALYFDDLHTRSGDMRHVQLAAENFVQSGLSTNDQIALFTASASVTVNFTADTSKILDALTRLRSRARVFDTGVCPRITPHDAYMIVNFPNSDAYKVALVGAAQCNCDDQANTDPMCYRQQEQIVLAQAKQTWEPMRELSENTLESIQAVVNYLETKPGERVLVLASSGFLTGTLEAQVDGIVDDALRAGVVINSLDAKGLYTEDPSHGRAQNELAANSAAGAAIFTHENENFDWELTSVTAGMTDFAVGTGGRFFHNRNDISAGYSSLAAAPETEYLLGFAPENARLNGAFHRLKVEVTMPGKFNVQARPGYFAPTKQAQEQVGHSTPEEQIDTAVRGSNERSDFPVTVGEKSPTTNNVHELSVQTHVDIQKLPFQQQHDRRTEMLTFVAALLDAHGNIVTAKEAQMELVLKRETFDRLSKSGINGALSLQAPSGSYRLRVVVQEAVHGEISATSQNVQIR